jgi:L-2-hydroxyglutarate oxidase LhgO
VNDAADVVVIGAGVIGCAVAHVLALRGRDVLVLEREARVGTGVTSRNSGVIHSGIYYPPGSRKARTCVRGNAMLYAWARRHHVPYRQMGKLVIARDSEELVALERLHDNAHASGAEGLRMLTTQEVRAREPDLPNMAGALLCERSGVIDPHDLTRSLIAAAESDGASLVPRTAVLSIGERKGGFVLQTSRGEIESAAVVNAAGLHADEVAGMVGLDGYTIFPCRGDYFRLRTTARYHHLLYPVQRSRRPGLGVHLTIDLSGSYRLGPDAEYVADKDDLGPAEHKRDAFVAAASALLGPLRPEQIAYDDCGLRPKLRPPHETEERDFVVTEHPRGMVHLIGIESPGLTAALALAEEAASLFTSG